MATGPFQTPRVPAAVADGLHSAVVQLHNSEYRRPDDLPVGPDPGGRRRQSGCQIAEDLAAEPRREVHLSVGSRQKPLPARIARVVHERGVTASPGLDFVGLPWLHTRGSALLGWIGDDAAHIAQRVDAHAPRLRGGPRMRRKHPDKIDGLLLAGLTELAGGALTGWPMSPAVTRPESLPKLGSLTAAAPRPVPSPPRKVGLPLAAGAWVNANAFGVIAFRPDLKDHPVDRASVATSFAPPPGGSPGSRRWPGSAGWRSDEQPLH